MLWDLENVGLPIERIHNRLVRLGYVGNISIELFGGAYAYYGNPQRLLDLVEGAERLGIPLEINWRFPEGAVIVEEELENAADIMLLANLTAWHDENPGPQNVFVFGGDHFYRQICEDLIDDKINVALIFVPGNVKSRLLKVFKRNIAPFDIRNNTSSINMFLD